MTADRWYRIGELFDASASLPPVERPDWLRQACGGDEELRAEVELLLAHDLEADREGFLDSPETLGDITGEWSQADDQPPAVEPARPVASWWQAAGVTNGFSPKAAITSPLGQRSDDETRAVVQSRLRELMLIHIVLFGVMLLLRPFVLGKVMIPIVAPFGVLTALLMVMVVLLSARPFSLRWLQQFELVMILALAILLIFYEGWAVMSPATFENRLRAERVTKNTMLLVSLVMLIDAIYVPKGWRRAMVVSASLAFVPLIALMVVYLIHPGSVRWLGEVRGDGNTALAVYGVDALFLLALAGISTFGAHTISRLRSEVVAARRFGQYRLGKQIGSGGMGEVFLAEHELLKRPCAVKLIRPEVVERAGSVERFEREVRINATLSHPNTVEIFDYGRTEDGTYYYVMEYLPGMSLADLVDRHGPLPPGRAVYLLRQVALALHEAHEAGLIHRDIKPSNIFAARRGGSDDVAKLLDFGLVRALTPDPSLAPGASDEGRILGTPLYMSPEQATGSRSLDPRSDIYSLGAVAYFLLTGRPPFDAPTAIEAIIAHVRDSVIPPSEVSPEVPADLDAVVLRCLAKDPADRFADAEALEVALGRSACASTWDKLRARLWWSDSGSIQVAATINSLADPIS